MISIVSLLLIIFNTVNPVLDEIPKIISFQGTVIDTGDARDSTGSRNHEVSISIA